MKKSSKKQAEAGDKLSLPYLLGLLFDHEDGWKYIPPNR
jgi:hypothetical protein